MKTELFLALRYLFRGKARHVSFISIIACAGITLGIATLVVVISVMNGFDQELMEKLLRFNYHVTVEGTQRDIPEDLIRSVRNVEGVENASVFLQTQVFAKLDEVVVPMVVRGIDFSNEEERKSFEKYIVYEKDTDAAPAAGVYAGSGLYNKFFLEDTLEYYPLQKRLKLEQIPIRGVFRIGLYDIDTNYLVTDIETARNLSENYLLFLGVRIKDPFEAKSIKSRLLPLFGNRYLINTWMESNEVLFSALKLEKFTMFIILSLIILVASFNIFATLTVNVVEKTKDIGVLRSLGFTSGKVLSIFSLQGVLLGLAGVLAGVLLGLLLCVLLKEYQFIRIPQEIYYIEYLPVAINLRDVLYISGVGIALSFFSSLVPAVRASRLSPCDALRYE
jgi:lipoprotein-releasing system permease protein